MENLARQAIPETYWSHAKKNPVARRPSGTNNTASESPFARMRQSFLKKRSRSDHQNAIPNEKLPTETPG